MPPDSISATEFKAKCLDILDQLSDRRLERLEITKRGRTVAVLMPPPADAAWVEDVHGFIRGTVRIPAGVDLTAPVLDDARDAELGILHR